MYDLPPKPMGHPVIWDFYVVENAVQKFEEAYGQSGFWATLFRRANGAIRAELRSEVSDPGLYFTLDFGESKQAYNDFRSMSSAEYSKIDQECESLTQRELGVGAFASVGLQPLASLFALRVIKS